jgi:hypothetical protein
LGQERVSGGKPQRDTGTNNESGVNQASQQEHLGLQLAHQFGLSSGRLKVLAAHDADADTRTDGAQANDQAGGQGNKADYFHDCS